VPRGLVALTGGTGFIGQRIVARLTAAGWAVRALVRRADSGLPGLGAATVHGALEDPASLAQLVEGAVAVVHVAGAIAAPSRHAFETINAQGTAQLVRAAATAESRPRVLLISSLAARAPELSAYAASKRRAETLAHTHAAGAIDLCILRPPAVYGPGDRATLPLFRQLERGLLLAPNTAGARFSLLYVDDLAELVARLLELPAWQGDPIEPDDGRTGGYGWAELAGLSGAVMGRRVRAIPVPRALLWLPAALIETGGRALSRSPILTRGKLREFYHDDWVSRGGWPQSLLATTARTQFQDGFARTMTWYKQSRWL
jgi:nucleoside-diphosphate-sugar epimerase